MRVKLEDCEVRRSCAKSFWCFAAQLLDENKPDISLAFNAIKQSFFKRLYSSEPKEFEQPVWLPTPPSPATPFNEELISNEEIQQAISNSMSRSTLSPRDQVLYMILKCCPSLAAALLDLYNACWSSSSVPAAWKVRVIQLIPKSSAVEEPRNPSSFRPIVLPPVSENSSPQLMVVIHVTKGYMDTNIQKAFVNVSLAVQSTTNSRWQLQYKKHARNTALSLSAS